MPASSDATLKYSYFINSKRLNFTDNVATVEANIDILPGNDASVVVAIYSGSDDLNNIHKFFIGRTTQSSQSNYFLLTINCSDVHITLNTERGNKNAKVNIDKNSSLYEGAFISVYKVKQPSNVFKESIIFSKNITFKTSGSYLLGTGYEFNPFFRADRGNRLYTYKYQIDDNDPVTTSFRQSGPQTFQADNIIINFNNTYNAFEVKLLLPATVSPGQHNFSMWMEPSPYYPTDLEAVANLSDDEELVTSFEFLEGGSMTASTESGFVRYDADLSDVSIEKRKLKTNCRAILAVNDMLVEGFCNRLTDLGTASFVFNEPYDGTDVYPFEVYIGGNEGSSYYSEYMYSQYDTNSGYLQNGREIRLFYVVRKDTPKPYKAIIPEQTIEYSASAVGWVTDKRYIDELNSVMNREVHVELSFLDEGAPYSEPIDIFTTVELKDRGESIAFDIGSAFGFHLSVFGDSNGCVYSKDDTFSYQGRIKFHVYTGTKPEPEPAPKPDPMMSSKWNKNFTAQYNDNSTAGEIKDFLRKEKKKITGHNIHELLDDLEEIGEGGDDSGSSCKCISLVEEVTPGTSDTTYTLKGATADKVYEAFRSGNHIGIVVNIENVGSTGYGSASGFLSNIYLDSSNNTYIAEVLFGASIFNAEGGTFYAFTNARSYSAVAGQELTCKMLNGGSAA